MHDPGYKLGANEVRERVSQTGDHGAHDVAGAVIAVRPREGAEDDDATTTQNDEKAAVRSVQSEENTAGCARESKDRAVEPDRPKHPATTIATRRDHVAGQRGPAP